jgi:DNA-directed RNA polymerase sigma subunit (sigma70/sigma32)
MSEMDLTRPTALKLWDRIRYDSYEFDWERYFATSTEVREGKSLSAAKRVALADVLSRLDYAERQVMIKRWGLSPSNPKIHTLADCTTGTEWSAQHIYQLERKALRHMREHFLAVSLDLLWGGRSKS